MRVSRDKAWKQVKADWRDVVLVCRKCSKKLDGGFGADGEKTLAKALRKALEQPERPGFSQIKPRNSAD